MTPSALSPILGLPTYPSIAEQLRLIAELTADRQGKTFAALAAEGSDTLTTYAALFALLTRGAIKSVELPTGEVGYRRRFRHSATCLAIGQQQQLQLAA